MVDPKVYIIALAFIDYVEQTLEQYGRESWYWTTRRGERLTCVEHVIGALLENDLAPLLKPVQLMINQGAENDRPI